MTDRSSLGVVIDEDGFYPTQWQHFITIFLYYIHALDCLYAIDTLAGMSKIWLNDYPVRFQYCRLSRADAKQTSIIAFIYSQCQYHNNAK